MENVFRNYEATSAKSSVYMYHSTLRAFAEFLKNKQGVEVGDLTEPESWRKVRLSHITLFEEFLNTESKPSTVTTMISIVRVYAELATFSGTWDPQDYVAMRFALRSRSGVPYLTA